MSTLKRILNGILVLGALAALNACGGSGGGGGAATPLSSNWDSMVWDQAKWQ